MNINVQDDWLSPITLEGDHVRLVPIQHDHAQDLVDAAGDGQLWKLWYTSVPSQKSITDYIDRALKDQKLGRALPFVVEDRQSGQVIGATRFCHAEPAHRRVEIGYTWYARRFQKTRVNTECKLLLLRFAFEQLNAIAVEFRTHWHNFPSRTAIARLGARQDGVLRYHQIDANGDYRDTVVFSIIAPEWPVVKKSLIHRLG